MDINSYSENYLRLHLLEVKGCTPVLRCLFEMIVSNSDANGDVNTYLSFFKIDIGNNKRHIPAGYQLLFPSNGDQTDVGKWDISLLSYVLIHCCMLDGQLDLKGKHNPRVILHDVIKNDGGLFTFLTNNKTRFDQLKASQKLTNEQYKTLNPSECKSTDSESWDIELVLRILFNMPLSVNKIKEVCKALVVRKVGLCHKNRDLKVFLAKHQCKFDELMQLGKMTDSNYKQLFSSQCEPDIENWDDEVLLCVVLNVCSSFSENTYRSVKTIRQLRKELAAHNANTEIGNEDFRNKWTELVEAITTIIQSEKLHVNIYDAIKEFKDGPLNIKWTISFLKEHYENLDFKHNTILEHVCDIKPDMKETNSRVASLEKQVEQLSKQLEEQAKDNKEIMRKLDSLLQQTPEPSYSEKRDIKCLGVTFVARGKSEAAVDRAEQMIYRAMNGISDGDTEKIKECTDKIINIFSNDDTVIVKVEHGSIILVVKCSSLRGVQLLLKALSSYDLKHRLNELASVLTGILGSKIYVDAHIPSSALEIVLGHIKDQREYQRFITMTVNAHSVKGLANIWQTFQDGTMNDTLLTLSNRLSRQIKETVDVSVMFPEKDLKTALQPKGSKKKEDTETCNIKAETEQVEYRGNLESDTGSKKDETVDSCKAKEDTEQVEYKGSLESDTAKRVRDISSVSRMAEGHMSIRQDYTQDSEFVLFNLQRGFEHFFTFVKDLQFDATKHLDDPDYIRIKLMPTISQAMTNFEQMKDISDTLNRKVNNDVEASLIDLKQKNDERKELDKKMDQLKAELKQMDENVKDAEKKLQSKKSQLENAESNLSSARQKLDDAKSSQKGVVIGGAAVAIASALILPFAPPVGVAGISGGLGTQLAGVTVMKKAVQEQSNLVETVRKEKESSESSFNTAKDDKWKLNNKIQALRKQMVVLEKGIQDKEKEIKETKEYQIKTIELNENIKKTYHDLSKFHASVKVLCLETQGGYSLAALQNPTLAVCASVTSLVRSPYCISMFGQVGIDNVKRILYQIEDVKWAVEDDCSDLI